MLEPLHFGCRAFAVPEPLQSNILRFPGILGAFPGPPFGGCENPPLCQSKSRHRTGDFRHSGSCRVRFKVFGVKALAWSAAQEERKESRQEALL